MSGAFIALTGALAAAEKLGEQLRGTRGLHPSQGSVSKHDGRNPAFKR